MQEFSTRGKTVDEMIANRSVAVQEAKKEITEENDMITISAPGRGFYPHARG